jgi:hypothetical protein
MWWAAAGIAYVAGPSAVLALVNAAVSMTVRATVRATWYVGQHVGQHIAAVLSPTPQFVPHTVLSTGHLGPQTQDAGGFCTQQTSAQATFPTANGEQAAVVIVAKEGGAVGAPAPA